MALNNPEKVNLGGRRMRKGIRSKSFPAELGLRFAPHSKDKHTAADLEELVTKPTNAHPAIFSTHISSPNVAILSTRRCKPNIEPTTARTQRCSCSCSCAANSRFYNGQIVQKGPFAFPSKDHFIRRCAAGRGNSSLVSEMHFVIT